jgi:murein DD-endopeptidase MepM/ murein hydrolase activator NlpD
MNLGGNFLSSKVPELASSLGVRETDPIAAFQKINSETRAANERQIREIVAASGPERYWRGAFQQLRNSAVTSVFAEHRAYFVGGEKVSEAIHYGYDLASTAGAPISAANAGRVIFTGSLGIYGNCVILDHGLGVTSLYAHLSRIDVREGDLLEKDQELGRSGATGLAGGDHLHFAILVGDTYVDPKEWWDPKWVREHVEERLATATP